MDNKFAVDNKKMSVAATAAGTVAFVSVPALAQQSGVQQVEEMVSSLGGLASAALAVAIVPLAISFAVKIVRRVMK